MVDLRHDRRNIVRHFFTLFFAGKMGCMSYFEKALTLSIGWIEIIQMKVLCCCAACSEILDMSTADIQSGLRILNFIVSVKFKKSVFTIF